MRARILYHWRRFWTGLSGPQGFGRIAARFALLRTEPYHHRTFLALLHPRGFITPTASIRHPLLRLGKNVYIGDRVIVTGDADGGALELNDGVHIYDDTYIRTGSGAGIRIGQHTHIHRGCCLLAFLSDIEIGRNVEVAPACAFYSYDHGIAAGITIMSQPLVSKGPITIGDGAWLGYGVSVLSGVSIGAGAVIGAGSVVARDIPENAIAVGVPAKVVRFRSELGAATAKAEVKT